MTHLAATMDFLEGTDPLKRENLGSPLKSETMVQFVDLSVGVAAVASAMENRGKEVNVGNSNAEVGLGVGMSLNVMGLVAVIGELLLMKLLRRLRNLLLKMRRM